MRTQPSAPVAVEFEADDWIGGSLSAVAGGVVRRDASGDISLGLPAVGFGQSGSDLVVTVTLLGGTL